ncbi:MAG TPA: hypothetical protein VFA46_22005 [Actinomycetes bacterium]|jgi:hypothetical protein|nr:hypothetical protein [Actinomycetes bacterium]
MTRTAPVTGVYLDTNVLRYFWEAASDPRPPCARGATNQAHCMQVAALRVVLYAPARGWELWVSAAGRQELQAHDRPRGVDDWPPMLFHDIDLVGGAVPVEEVEARAERYRAALGRGGTQRVDLQHLAWAALTDWVSVLITNDRGLSKGADRLRKQPEFLELTTLQVVDPIKAETALAIRPGDPPAWQPHPSHPHAATWPWWIPGAASSTG